ncbi:hypothetical protein GCM10023318_19160 [Nocardia callitridis]|uniref:Uncharacterized protein n=1 Tax=Nocardia callitridis TaxID=648753 RepID=A0ABP9K5C2_9NOCA
MLDPNARRRARNAIPRLRDHSHPRRRETLGQCVQRFGATLVHCEGGQVVGSGAAAVQDRYRPWVDPSWRGLRTDKSAHEARWESD